MTNSAISVNSLSKNFRLYHERNRYIKAALLRGRRAKYEEFWALNDVSFEVAHGSTLGIIGSNGSGKTTMLKCLTGIYTPDKGRIRIDDWEMRDDVQERIAKLWKESTTESLVELGDLAGYKQDFLNLFGFGFDGVDYNADTNEMVQVKSIN